MKRVLLIITLIAVALSGGTALARISVSDAWKDKEYKGPAKKIAVFCIMNDRAGRILFEDEFVRQIKARGVNGMPGYVIIAPDKFVERDAAMAKMTDLGADAVLSTRLIDAATAKEPIPEPAAAGSSQQMGFYEYVYDPRPRDENQPAHLETNLIDLKTGQRVWTIRTKTRIETVNRELAMDYIELIIKRLASDKMIK